MVNYIAKNVLLQDINTKEYLIPYTENKLPIGTIIPCLCSSSWTPQGTLPLDGAEYSSTQFPSLWNNYLTASTTEDSDTSTNNPKLVTCTYTEYASDIATYGQCAKFGVDTTNNKFKVPLIKDGSYITQANTDAEIAKAYNESLPNIKGEISKINLLDQGSSANGALGLQFMESYNYSGGSINKNNYKVSFNASNSSSVYADNAKVQGDNVRLRWFVVVANGTVSQSAMDWSAWATSLNEKLNTDVSTNISATGKSFVAGLSMPSTKKNLQIVGASGATYVAPANGWYCGFCQEGGIRLSNKSVNSFGVHSPQTVWSGGKAYIPCQKGDKIIFEYAGTTTKLIFYYAEGGTTSGGPPSGGTASGGTYN